MSHQSIAQDQAISLDKALSYLPAGSDAAIVVIDADTGTRLYQQREEQFQPPASIQKTITALAAASYLPKDFRFSTRIEQQGDNLIVRFSGDPTLMRTDLARLLRQARQKGITAVKGDVLLNGGQFNGYERAAGWPWDILGVCYSAPSSSLSLEHNCVQGALYSNKALGQTTRVNIPSHQPINVTTKAKVVSKDQQQQSHCDLELTTGYNNRYQLDGCLVKRDKPLPLNFAVQDTTAFITAVIKQELGNQGIRLSGKVKRDDSAKGKLIATHYSSALPELLDTMMKDSDNLIADNLTKTLGARYFQQAGTFANGTEAIKAIIKEKTGINLESSILADGSGLSRNNRITAAKMAEVITYIHQQDEQLELLNTMPISGQSGTLRYRQSLRQPPLKGAIAAKSGSLYGTYNLAGQLTAKSGKTLLFVQMVTNYHPPERDENAPAVATPIEAFERQLYRQLYDSY
ncbi:serine-type D-Ala-D-Ala carboxypeptidase [Photobacterium sanctipauli]|uniref:Serine-type D-Ala-D-Ala carboxypeptidase n=5 Tax=Photobacterium sanctipauli TaxID=1342794 RepID=A0A2T3NS20_9GAMM|nr:serine-type D-Ala-D-Ala carboxypeptidase [Photobacterium sanctipauli]